MKRKLSNVTLIGVDCVNFERLALAADICEAGIEFGAVKLLSSLPSTDARHIEIEHLSTVEAYSRFCFENLAEYVDTEFALIFQHDGFILNPDAWTDEFLRYDYIGAPWFDTPESVAKYDLHQSYVGNWSVGNGGFSLRSKKLLTLCKNLVTEGLVTETHPEDMIICVRKRTLFEEHGISFAPVELAQRFSREANEYYTAWDGQFGFHNLKYTDISSWRDQHPEYPVAGGTMHTLWFDNKDVSDFKRIRSGEKRFEVRAGLPSYFRIQPGHSIIFRTKDNPEARWTSVEKHVKNVTRVTSLDELLRKFNWREVSPSMGGAEEWRTFLLSLPGYPERIKKDGLIVLELE